MRVSLFGGGTDVEAYFREHGGEVLGFAINKYVYLSLRKLPPFFEHKHRIVYSSVETVRSIADIVHPAIRAVLDYYKPHCGIELHYDGDLPSRSGMGSSSSFTVGLLNALHAFRGHHVSKLDLATEAIHIEREILKEAGGWQDQIWAAYGGMNKITFRTNGEFEVTPVVMPEERRHELMSSFMLFFTGLSRYSYEISAKQAAVLKEKARSLKIMKEMVSEAAGVLTNERLPLSEIGLLLHQSWLIKRELTDAVTTTEIDNMYGAARSNGACGGKLLGAGGGGFLLVFVPPENQAQVREALKTLIEVPFDICWSGSTIALYEPNGV